MGNIIEHDFRREKDSSNSGEISEINKGVKNNKDSEIAEEEIREAAKKKLENIFSLSKKTKKLEKEKNILRNLSLNHIQEYLRSQFDETKLPNAILKGITKDNILVQLNENNKTILCIKIDLLELHCDFPKLERVNEAEFRLSYYREIAHIAFGGIYDYGVIQNLKLENCIENKDIGYIEYHFEDECEDSGVRRIPYSDIKNKYFWEVREALFKKYKIQG